MVWTLSFYPYLFYVHTYITYMTYIYNLSSYFQFSSHPLVVQICQQSNPRQYPLRRTFAGPARKFHVQHVIRRHARRRQRPTPGRRLVTRTRVIIDVRFVPRHGQKMSHWQQRKIFSRSWITHIFVVVIPPCTVKIHAGAQHSVNGAAHVRVNFRHVRRFQYCEWIIQTVNGCDEKREREKNKEMEKRKDEKKKKENTPKTAPKIKTLYLVCISLNGFVAPLSKSLAGNKSPQTKTHWVGHWPTMSA